MVSTYNRVEIYDKIATPIRDELEMINAYNEVLLEHAENPEDVRTISSELQVWIDELRIVLDTLYARSPF